MIEWVLFGIKNINESFDCNKSIRPEKWEPERHESKETISQEYLNPSRYEYGFRYQHEEESEEIKNPIIFLTMYHEWYARYSDIYSSENIVISHEWDESDHEEYW